MKFELGDEIIAIDNKPLKGNDIAPALEIGKKYTIKKIVLDSDGNQHLDVGIPSTLNFVLSWETKEDLPHSDSIHWCHPSRFKK